MDIFLSYLREASLLRENAIELNRHSAVRYVSVSEAFPLET